MQVSLPIALRDGANFLWSILSDGRFGSTARNAFDAGLDLPDLRTVSTALSEMDGRQVLLQPGAAAGTPHVSLERRIYVPEDAGWARVIDTATNTSDTAQDYTFRLVTNLGSDAASDIAWTSSGDAVLDGSDVAVLNVDGSGRDPFTGLAFGDGTRAPDAAAYTSVDIIEYSFTVTLAPGARASVMSFALQAEAEVSAQALLASLGGPLAEVAEAGIPRSLAETIVNYDVAGFVEQVAYFGNEFADMLVGTGRDEAFTAGAGDDLILAGAGDDIVYAGNGADVVQAGADDDRVLGDDAAQNASTAAQTASGPRVFSAHLPEFSDSGTATLDLFLAEKKIPAAEANIVVAIDRSLTMNSTLDAGDTVGDLNQDGLSDRRLDAVIAGVTALTERLAIDGFAASDLMLIGFDTDATRFFDGAVGAGRTSVFAALDTRGNTSFEAPLQAALAAFAEMGEGANHLYCITDGTPTDGTGFLDEVTALTDPAGVNAIIRAIGFGPHVGQVELDLVDDGTANNSHEIVQTSADLTARLLEPALRADDVASGSVQVNGTVAGALDPSDFTETPLGLRAALEVAGLLDEAEDQIALDLVLSAGETLRIDALIEHAADLRSDDTLLGEGGRDVLAGLAGSDVLIGGADDDALDGGPGADRLSGDAGDDWLIGGPGDDLLHGGPGADLMIGGAGNDIVSYSGATGSVTVDLVAQTVSGLAAAGDRIAGITGAEGTAQDDTLLGDGADNHFRPGKGDDLVIGGAGFDTVDYSDVDGGVYLTLQLQNRWQSAWAAGEDRLEGIDALIGSRFDDYLIGDAGYNALYGGAGNDVLKSKGGNDRLDGGAGDDRITGDTGNETIIGGPGEDELFGLRGQDVIYAGPGADYVAGGRDADRIYGQGGADTLRGNIGHDQIWGGRGGDDLRGGGGTDTLYGEQGSDFLMGENGTDTLDGGKGDDVLIGGAGADVFVFAPGYGFDEMRDFTAGEDRLDFSAFALSGMSALQAMASDRPSGLRLDLGPDATAFLTGVEFADLSAADLLF